MIKIIQEVKVVSEKYGLYINMKKKSHKIMIVNGSGEENNNDILKNFEVVHHYHYTYLGSIIESKGGSSKEIKRKNSPWKKSRGAIETDFIQHRNTLRYKEKIAEDVGFSNCIICGRHMDNERNG